MDPQIRRDGSVTKLVFPNGRELGIDFVGDRARYWRSLRGRQELIAKAVGLPAKKDAHIFDATVGLGEDAWTLARLGATVVGCEREPLLFQLLASAHAVALQEEKTREIAERLILRSGEATQILHNWPEADRLDAIFLDPMFPEAKKTALPRLEMQLLRDWLVADDRDFEKLFEIALTKAERVVVKRPLHAPLFRSQPKHQFKGKSVRYDLYLRR